MKSPFTDKEMEKVETPNCSKSDRYYRCRDTGALFLSNHISKEDLMKSQEVKKTLVESCKA